MCSITKTSLWVLMLILMYKEMAFSYNIDLPSEHLPYYFNNYPKVAQECSQDNDCPYKPHLDKNVCWGFEDNCKPLSPNSYSSPICDGDHKGWVKTKPEQLETFFQQGDFGYVRNFRNSMKLICKPDLLEDSSLECSEYMTFCRGRNIMIDFRRLANRTSPVMYDMDVLEEGEVGGYCKLDKNLFKGQLSHISALQSWAPELQHFVELDKRPLSKDSKMCDRIIKAPTFLMKIDATVNMYHHFCDFFNLYATLFVNATSNNPDMFSKNVRIAIWRTFKYQSNFEASFRAFTSYPLMNLDDFKGKRVCFKNVVFPLLPRMIFGLYYNTPLIWGCQNSGLFHAFSKFFLHRLQIDQRPEPNPRKIKVTFLSRLTKYRRVLNEDELLGQLVNNTNVVVNKVTFTWRTDFMEQLKVIQDTDVLIGMHGAGLTHMLFLPDWAAVFELYNCGDAHCYEDLARLRGLKYLTWKNQELLREESDGVEDGFDGGHEKHKNYSFDPEEFMNLVNEAISHVKRHINGPASHDEL